MGIDRGAGILGNFSESDSEEFNMAAEISGKWGVGIDRGVGILGNFSESDSGKFNMGTRIVSISGKRASGRWRVEVDRRAFKKEASPVLPERADLETT